MKKTQFIPFVLGLLLVGVWPMLNGCSDQPEEVSNETSMLTIELTGEAKKATLIHFYGDRQTIIDYPSIDAGKIEYALSDDLPLGIYRLEVDDYLFDFVHSGESVHLAIDLGDAINGVKVIASEENDHYLNFLKDYQKVFQDSVTCDSYRELSKKYVIGSELFSEKVIKFLLNTSFNCGHDDWKAYINSIEIDEELLSTPYFQLQMEGLVESMMIQYPDNNDLYSALTDDLSGKVKHYITTAFWNVGLNTGNHRYFAEIGAGKTQGTDCVSETPESVTPFSIGMKVDDDLKAGAFNNSETQQHVFFIDGGECGFTEAEKERLKATVGGDAKIEFHEVKMDELTEDKVLKYNLFISPMILVTNESGVLLSTFVGYEDCLNSVF